jgi:membrane protease YdiL (CAAX protease family)
MEASTYTNPTLARRAATADRAATSADRYAAVEQYSLAKILGVWAAAAVPMGILAWLVAPWLSHRLGGRDPFIESLLICFTAGLIWQFVFTLIMVRRELGSLRPSRVIDALWLRAPRDPKTKRVGGKVWWWVLAFIALSAAINALPIDPVGPLPRDFPHAIDTDRVRDFFAGNWPYFGMLVVLTIFNTVLGEELLFRGLLLPRMRGVFGKRDWIANGVLFGIYHLHQPWSMPASVIDGALCQAYPTKRFQSAWMGIVVHSVPSVLIFGVVLAMVI